jgi:hypothetical protein
MAEYEIVNNKSNDFSAQNLRLISRQNLLAHWIACQRPPLVDLTDSLAIVIILWHEKYWEEFFPGVPRWITGMFYLESQAFINDQPNRKKAGFGNGREIRSRTN